MINRRFQMKISTREHIINFLTNIMVPYFALPSINWMSFNSNLISKTPLDISFLIIIQNKKSCLCPKYKPDIYLEYFNI